MTRDGEKLIELVYELGTRMTHLVSDMVPPRAQVHLLNAQRELITALMLIYEHRVSTGPEMGTRTSRTAGGAAPRRRTPRRVGKIPIE